jgi:hypothetical protein
LGSRFRKGRGYLKPPREAPARRVFMCGVKQPQPEEPSAGTLDIKRKPQTLESSPVFMAIDSEPAAKPSCPKPPERRNGKRQIMRFILKNNEKEYVIRVLLDRRATIPLLNRS